MISLGMENSTRCFCSFAKVALNWILIPSLSVVLMLSTYFLRKSYINILFYIPTYMCSSNNTG